MEALHDNLLTAQQCVQGNVNSSIMSLADQVQLILVPMTLGVVVGSLLVFILLYFSGMVHFHQPRGFKVGSLETTADVNRSGDTVVQSPSICAMVSSQALPSHRKMPYRIEEEHRRGSSAEYTRRGLLWSRHASWQLPSAPRYVVEHYNLHTDSPSLRHVRAVFSRFQIDINTGFLPPEDPLQRLPFSRYHIWEDLADDLPKLLGARLGQARVPLEQLPVLSTEKLITDAELRRAHLLLCLFAHAYVWGGPTPLDVLPEGIAKPLVEVSGRLGIPPVLGHPSIVMYNWRRLDVAADICMENLATLNNFFDGRDESWFYLITVEVEAKGAGSILPMTLAMDAIERYNEEVEQNANLKDLKLILAKRRFMSVGTLESTAKDAREHVSRPLMESISRSSLVDHPDDDDALDGSSNRYYHPRQASFDESEKYYSFMYEEDMPQRESLLGELNVLRVIQYVTMQLEIVAASIKDMNSVMNCMNEGCHPFIFYHRVRPFLSGWKQNPTLPNGVLYTGVSTERFQCYGGSAAQSALIPFLDIGLGVQHESSRSQGFLLAMRDYMLRPHREYLKYWEKTACLKEFIDQVMQLVGVSADDLISNAPAAATAQNGADRSELDDAKDAVRELVVTYDKCLRNLEQFRTIHISLVARYIIQQQENKTVAKNSLENTAGGKGTGGTDLMSFLKPIRDNCRKKLICKGDANTVEAKASASDAVPSAVPVIASTSSSQQAQQEVSIRESETVTDLIREGSPEVYYKEEGHFGDIDLYRGASRPAKDNRVQVEEDIDLLRGAAHRSLSNQRPNSAVLNEPLQVTAPIVELSWIKQDLASRAPREQ